MTADGRAVSIDGRLVGAEAAFVSVYDRGFLFGDAVFEVLRTYGGRPFALDAHVARLRGSAARVAMALPWDDAVLRRDVEQTVAAAGGGDLYVRVVVTRGSGPMSLDPDTAGAPLRVVLAQPVAPPAREAYARGIAAITMRVRRTVDDTEAEGAKVTNYLPNLLAIRAAKARGGAEALVVDASGHVLEGATSNVFAVVRGTLVTPPESAGILAGITRRHVIDAARRSGMQVEEDGLPLETLVGADEAFITSSIREVLPVVKVDDRVVGPGTPGPVARRLHRALREAAGVGSAPMPWE
ncbi:MAG: aminotransferase class IV [Polyangiaceae bacterium]